jgi:transposase
MFFPEGRVRVFVHGRPVDMRKSFTGLIAPTKHAVKQDPLSDHLFVFVNHNNT